jgi:ABC-2 type transport system permease protein
MLQTYIVFKKELRQFIYSPIAYIVAGVFHAILGYFFYNSAIGYSKHVVEMAGSGFPGQIFTPTVLVLQSLFNSMGTVFLLLTPLITMRLVAEEKRAQTMELLMSSPLSLSSILLGKYLAALSVYSCIISLTIYMPITADILSSVSWGHVMTAYLGLFLMGGAMISVGLFASTVTEKQVVAAVLSIGILVIFWFVGGGIGAASQRATDFLSDISLYKPFYHLISGLVDFRDIFFLLSYSVFMLFLSHRVMESSRW